MSKVPSIKELKKYLKKQTTYKTKSYLFLHNIYRNVAIHISRFLLHTPITANQITILSILIGILGGFFLFIGKFWSLIIGVVFLIFFAIIDRVDGVMARYRKMKTFRGKYLSLLAHYIGDLAMYIGFILGVYNVLQNNTVLIFGFTMLLFDILIKFAVSTNIQTHILTNRKINLREEKPGKGIMREMNTLVFSYLYFPFWILIGIILDKITASTLIPLGSFLILFIIFHAVARGFKFFGTVIYYSKKI